MTKFISFLFVLFISNISFAEEKQQVTPESFDYHTSLPKQNSQNLINLSSCNSNKIDWKTVNLLR